VEARLASVDAATLVMPEPAAAGELPQRVRAWFGGWREVPLVPMGALRAELEGPALIVEPHSTVVLEEGWRARRLDGGELLLEDDGPARVALAPAVDAARIEIFNNLFMHIAEQMGEVLRATAQSVNIRERLDYSCALFDGDGGLVANAPHMPVHLGSMGASVRSVIAAQQARLRPGDSWLLNSPYHGGTHLPDMTVVTPVFMGAGARPRFFVASRAHHADIGGMTPGSMPPFSRTIEEEGALFECFALVRGGKLRESGLRAALAAVRVDIDGERRRARVDFTGTSPEGAHNFNAPRAVRTAAVLYVFRTLIERPIPLNEGCLEPLELVIPPGSLLDPRPPAAVAAGNVETSQCIVDALYGALGILAASQGTMNNL